MISFVIPGQPFGKPAVARDRQGNRYRPREVTAFYRAVSWLVRGPSSGWDREPLLAPVVTITAVKARPQRKPRGYPLPWLRGRVPCLAKPDADNVAKSILDALTVGGVFEDDQRVAALTVSTWYAAEGEDPHTAVQVVDLARVSRESVSQTSPNREPVDREPVSLTGPGETVSREPVSREEVTE